MDEKYDPKHTQGPYYACADPESSDALIYTDEQVVVARVLSAKSGHPNAPSDDAVMYNAALFEQAYRMHHYIHTILGRPGEPMHPWMAKAGRDLLEDIDRGRRRQIQVGRLINSTVKTVKRRLKGESVASVKEEENDQLKEEGPEDVQGPEFGH